MGISYVSSLLPMVWIEFIFISEGLTIEKEVNVCSLCKIQKSFLYPGPFYFS
jgi:hypothetical protein